MITYVEGKATSGTHTSGTHTSGGTHTSAPSSGGTHHSVGTSEEITGAAIAGEIAGGPLGALAAVGIEVLSNAIAEIGNYFLDSLLGDHHGYV